MPELPEVETVRRGLAPVMEAGEFARIRVNRPDLRWPLPERMDRRLVGRTVLRLRRRAKYILADISSGETLLVHLGMSGRMLVSGDPVGRFVRAHPPAERHDHVVFDMASGARITFNDPRRFGAMDLFETAEGDSHPLLAGIGPEPLGNAFNETHLVDALAGRRTPIKAALLDQRTVAGLGNIYVCEALHRARISPRRLAGTVSRRRAGALAGAIREVLEAAIAAGGSSLRDYRRSDGELGYFQHSFDVYGREGAPCRAEGCRGKVRRIVQSGRSSFFCPRCQR